MGQRNGKQNQKFSIIIPTLWKSNLTYSLIDYLNASDFVDEIILIQNVATAAGKALTLNFKKVKLIQPKNNLYVNASWNLGVAEAKNEFIGLLNDDILINKPDQLLKEISRQLETVNLIGVDPRSYEPFVSEFSITPGSAIGNYWGCAIFIKKSHYVYIPEDMKIHFGDDWLCIHVGAPYKFIYPIILEKSKSSDVEDYCSIIREDRISYNRHIEFIEVGASFDCSLRTLTHKPT